MYSLYVCALLLRLHMLIWLRCIPKIQKRGQGGKGKGVYFYGRNFTYARKEENLNYIFN